ncbi:DUF3575 domain-containing protein [uncultured Tenacibaculum sp.]|uniref:DUF3575 domain-containing protein n=1 Tax=uncultured Tenacibaculum sp. TaxID=174713 RepID=UPI002613F7C3|nr:DUF3575 domain-containing protein [uncultured Tenacibaculum sp.]
MLKYKSICFAVFFLLLSTSLFSQEKDTIISTPFKKEKWLIGLSGSFSSNTNNISSTSKTNSTNNYGLEIKIGKFKKDRWLLGGVLLAERNNGNGNIKRDVESFFLAPMTSYYFSMSKDGSLFISLAAGYIKYREENTFTSNSDNLKEILNGNGLGLVVNLGYSYPITNHVTFDIGVNLTNYWLTINKESNGSSSFLNTSAKIDGVNFAFGFNVLLDKLF